MRISTANKSFFSFAHRMKCYSSWLDYRYKWQFTTNSGAKAEREVSSCLVTQDAENFVFSDVFEVLFDTG